MASCLKAGSYRGASCLHSRHLISFFFLFFFMFSLLDFEDFGFGGHIIFSYCNLLYVVLFLFLTRNSHRTSALVAVFLTAVHQSTFEGPMVKWGEGSGGASGQLQLLFCDPFITFLCFKLRNTYCIFRFGLVLGFFCFVLFFYPLGHCCPSCFQQTDAAALPRFS